MNLLQAMRVFLKVAETESFGRAAAALDMSNAVVTRYVSLLETHLNTRLLNRTTRSVSLTEAGGAYAEGCRTVIEQIETMEASVANTSVDPSGTLKLVASASFSLLRLTPMLRDFRERYPNVKLRVTLLRRPVDIVAEGFDVGIVVPHLVNSGMLINRPLFRVSAVLVASPAYLARRGTPSRPAALAKQDFLAPSADIHGSTWTFIGPSSAEENVALDPAYTVNSSHMLRQAAISGMGIAVLPESYVVQDIEAGSLVRLLPGYTLKDADKAHAGEDHDADIGKFLPHPADQEKPITSISPRLGHGEVRDQNIAGRDGKFGQQRARVIRLAYDLHCIVGIEKRLHAKKNERMVICQDYSKFQGPPLYRVVW